MDLYGQKSRSIPQKTLIIFFSQGDPHIPIWGGIESQGL